MRAAGLLLACSLYLPLVAAVNPIDNDAGSGGDAGDHTLLALSIDPGVYRGQVGWGFDPVDAYAIEAEAGQWLSFSLSPGKSSVASIWAPDQQAAHAGLDYGGTYPGGNTTILLPYSGPWFIVIQPWEFDPGLIVPYEFEVRLERPTSALFVAPEHRLTTMEFAWDEPARVVMEARLVVKNAPATAQGTGMFFIIEADVAPKFGRFLLTIYVGDQGFGHGVRVEPLGLSAEVPSLDMVEVRATELGGGIIFPWHNQQLTGRVKMTLLHTAGAKPSMYFSADVPVQSVLHERDDIVEWRDTTGPADLAVVAPGVSIAGPRELELEAGRRTFGFFSPWWHEGLVVDPVGAVHALGPMDSARLYGGVEGTWRFRINASAGAGPVAESPFLVAADVPHLGLGPDLTAGFRIRHGDAPWEALLERLDL